MLPLALLATLTFIALHMLAERGGRMPFAVAFPVGRAGAALCLSATGFFALVHWWPFAERVYVLKAPDPWATALVGIPIGHFVADFLLMAYGRRWHGERSRSDLLIHHGLGMVAASLTLTFPIAAPLYLTLFTTEMMPVTSGITVWARHRGLARVERWGMAARLAVLVGWRFLFWIWLGAAILWNAQTRPLIFDERVVYGFSFAFLFITFSLDLFWIRGAWRALGKPLTKR